MDSEGTPFKEQTSLENLSGGGLYVFLTRKIRVGTSVSLAVRLSASESSEKVPAVHLAARASVLRVEPKPDGTYGVAVEFGHRRVL